MSLPINTTEFWKDRLTKSKDYGDIHHSVYISSNKLWAHIEEVHFEILKREAGESTKILDAGCGYGRCASIFNPKCYVGVDFSPDFIDVAKREHKDHVFIREDLKKLPFKDKEFDMAFCISIEQMIVGNLGVDEWKSIEKELCRVAKKVLILEYENPEIFRTLMSKDTLTKNL
jgi:ubiquinone/menaquinone biosynthesis C-methylase UbiE